MELKDFFIPKAETKDQSERVYNAVKDYLNSIGRPTTDERIYSVNYTDNGETFTDSVGKAANMTNETVIAIFRSTPDLCYICTENAGVVRGEPIMVRPNHVVYFSE